MKTMMLRTGLLLALVAAASTLAYGFEAYFSDPSGNPVLSVREGRRVYLAVEDPFKLACGIDSFKATVTLFDYKTSAYRELSNVQFVETGYARGIFVWDQGAIPIGDRYRWTPVTYNYPHHVGGRPASEQLALGFEHVMDNRDFWEHGNWEYVNEGINDTNYMGNASTPHNAQRFQFAERLPADPYFGTSYYPNNETQTPSIPGRFTNHDTVVAIVHDKLDGYAGVAQIKIERTQATISTSLKEVYYGCSDIIVTIEDRDESLSSDKVDFVPFFVIVNPGSWNPVQDGSPTNFCTLMATGGVMPDGTVRDYPIRWYSICGLHYIRYPHPDAVAGLNWDWAPEGGTDIVVLNDTGVTNEDRAAGVARATFYAQETGTDTGVFTFNFGSLDQLQDRLGFGRFPAGTTIAFYYVDPNDFSDMTLTTIHVASPYTRSRVYITDAYGNPVREVRLGEDALYVRVEDSKQNIDACRQEAVWAFLCDVHGEDDREALKLDEIRDDAGVFFSHSGMPLLPVWDAVGGYQLVIGDGRFQAFNADTIYVRYNSMRYTEEDMNRR